MLTVASAERRLLLLLIAALPTQQTAGTADMALNRRSISRILAP